MADGAGSLELLRNAAMVLVFQRHTGIAPHAVPKINAETLSHPARVAVRAVKYGTGAVVVEIANVAKIFGKSFFVELALFVDAELGGRLQGSALHTRDLGDGIPIQGRFFFLVRCGFFSILVGAQPARE